jgi:hypothetical protein
VDGDYYRSREILYIVDGGNCFTHSSGDAQYSNSEKARITITHGGWLSARSFHTEYDYDFLTIAGERYSGNSGPAFKRVEEGEEIVWTSDSLVVKDGFKVCFGDAPPTASPTGSPTGSPTWENAGFEFTSDDVNDAYPESRVILRIVDDGNCLTHSSGVETKYGSNEKARITIKHGGWLTAENFHRE